jgi:hypothetical protein
MCASDGASLIADPQTMQRAAQYEKLSGYFNLDMGAAVFEAMPPGVLCLISPMVTASASSLGAKVRL